MERKSKKEQRKALQRYEETRHNIKYWKLSNWRKDALAKARFNRLSERFKNPIRPVQAANDSPDYKRIVLILSISLNVVLIYALMRLIGML